DGQHELQVAELEVGGGRAHGHESYSCLPSNQFTFLMHPDWVRSGSEETTMPTPSGGLQVESLGQDLFLFRGASYDSGSLVVLSGGDALLVDGLASVADAERLRETLVGEWGKRVLYLLSTHYFSDHMAAWNLFPEAAVLAHENALQTFWTEDYRTPEEAAHFRSPTFLLGGRMEMAWGRFSLEIFDNSGHTS